MNFCSHVNHKTSTLRGITGDKVYYHEKVEVFSTLQEKNRFELFCYQCGVTIPKSEDEND